MQVDESGGLKSTWMKVLRIHLKKCNLLEDLAQHRREWHNRIHNIVGIGSNDDKSITDWVRCGVRHVPVGSSLGLGGPEEGKTKP